MNICTNLLIVNIIKLLFFKKKNIQNNSILYYFIGYPYAMRFEDGRFIDLSFKIKENIKDGEHVWFLL